VRLAGNGATTWYAYAAENAEYFKAYAPKAAFECVCGISRTVLIAWPGTDTALDNDQLQTFAAAHLGPGDPELSTHAGAPIEAPNRAGTGWRKISDAMDCRATNVYTASFPGKAGFSRRHGRRPPRQNAIRYTARPSEQASSPTANTPLP
jgi:hypothetical protein